MNPVNRALIALTWIPVVYTFTNHVLQPYQVTGRSMSPTFNPGTSTTANDVVLVSKYGAKERAYERGEVVMFNSPSDPERVVTKRVTGLQGDVVSTRHPYPKPEVVVPRNHMWVEGDNEFHSIDSNTLGPISKGLMIGKVVMVIWPLSRFGFIEKKTTNREY